MFEILLALRSLRRNGKESLLAIATLAAGLTCTVIVLTLIDGFLLRPLPFPKPEELVPAGTFGEYGSDYLDPMSREQARAISDRLAGLAQVAGFQRTDVILSDSDTQRDYGAYVSANLFRVLGVTPLLGRDFNADDEEPGAAPVLAISERLWQTRYGSDPNIVGRVVRANAQSATVAAVMPGDFSFPTKESIWMPATAQDVRFDLVLRRAASVSNVALAAALQDWLEQAHKSDPANYQGKHAGIGDMRNINWAGTLREPLYMMLASAVLLLLLACTSAANILMARVSTQYRDIVVRIALGASWRRIFTYVLARSLIFSVAAAIAALAVTAFAMAWLIAWFHANDFGPAHWQRFEVDWRVLAFTGGAVVATTLLTTLPAALRAHRISIGQGLRDTTAMAIVRPPRFLRVGLLAQVALTSALLISVAMMVRAIVLIDSAEVGVRSEGLLTSRVTIPAKTYATQIEQRAFLNRIRERLTAEAGITGVSIGSAVPGSFWSYAVGVAADDGSDGATAVPMVRAGVVDGSFFGTYGVVLRQGRLFDGRDGPEQPRTAIVDDGFARRFGLDQVVIGRRFQVSPKGADPYSITVVGVVNDLKLGTRMQPVQPAMLFFEEQAAPPLTQSVTVRVDPAAKVSAADLDRVMQDVDRDVPLTFSRYEDVMLRHTNTVHLFARVFYIVGIVAFMLAASGLYGVMMVGVARRTREIALKRALGARAMRILATIFAEAAAYAAAGVALGLMFGIPVARAVDRSLIKFGGSTDPIVLCGALIVVLIAAAAGAVLPAVQAVRIDPARALKAD